MARSALKLESICEARYTLRFEAEPCASLPAKGEATLLCILLKGSELQEQDAVADCKPTVELPEVSEVSPCFLQAAW